MMGVELSARTLLWYVCNLSAQGRLLHGVDAK